MKKVFTGFMLCLLAMLNAHAQINISTGLTASLTSPLPIGANEIHWTLPIAPPLALPVTPIVSSYGTSLAYEIHPVALSNAMWLNQTASHYGNPLGAHTYERRITILPGTTTLNLNFRIAHDNALTLLELEDPSSGITNLLGLVVPTTPLNLSMPVIYNVSSPMVGNWILRARTVIINNSGGFMVSGKADTMSTSAPCATAGNVTTCPCTPVTLLGGPTPGGIYTGYPGGVVISSPYTPPALGAFTTYTYTDLSGCVSSPATITVTPVTIPTFISPFATTFTSATVCWNPVPCAVQYGIRWRVAGTVPWAFSSLYGGGTTCGNLSLIPPSPNGQCYQIQIRARNACGQWTAWSPSTTFCTPPAPPCVFASGLSVSAASGSGITWNPVLGAGRYNVRYRFTTTAPSPYLVGPWYTASCILAPTTTLSLAIAAGHPMEAQVRVSCGTTCPATAASLALNPWSVWSPVFSFVSKPNSLISNELDEYTKVFPNPTQGILNVEMNLAKSENREVRIYDMIGRIVLQSQFKGSEGLNQFDINMSALAKGMYVLKVTSNNELRFTTKIEKSE